MGDKTKIEWTEATWNPITGCSKVSEGCRNCYALRHWPRLAGNDKSVYYGRKFTDIQCHTDRLNQPLRWDKPRRIFVNSMSDLFHESVPDSFIDKVFAVMALAGHHTFQILTKRPERMLKYLTNPNRKEFIGIANEGFATPDWLDEHWPLPNLWLGVSVENQETANQRIPFLLQAPAAVRWISAEPLLERIYLSKFRHATQCINPLDWLHWVVVGGESGPNARPMHPEWVRNLRDQCKQAAVPFLFKQWGEWAQSKVQPIPKKYITCGTLLRPDGSIGNHRQWWDGDASLMERLGSKTNGRLLDGILHDGYPK